MPLSSGALALEPGIQRTLAWHDALTCASVGVAINSTCRIYYMIAIVSQTGDTQKFAVSMEKIVINQG